MVALTEHNGKGRGLGIKRDSGKKTSRAGPDIMDMKGGHEPSKGKGVARAKTESSTWNDLMTRAGGGTEK